MQKSPEVETHCSTYIGEVSSATHSSSELSSLEMWGKLVSMRSAFFFHPVASHCKLSQTCRTRLAQMTTWDCIVTSGLK